jgi:hypothetical protein
MSDKTQNKSNKTFNEGLSINRFCATAQEAFEKHEN